MLIVVVAAVMVVRQVTALPEIAASAFDKVELGATKEQVERIAGRRGAERPHRYRAQAREEEFEDCWHYAVTGTGADMPAKTYIFCFVGGEVVLTVARF